MSLSVSAWHGAQMARLCLLGIRTTLSGHGGLCQDNRVERGRGGGEMDTELLK